MLWLWLSLLLSVEAAVVVGGVVDFVLVAAVVVGVVVLVLQLGRCLGSWPGYACDPNWEK